MAATKRKAPPSPARLAPQIIKWFRANARDLPWRRTLDPYAVWVSEIMLQQTQVRTVIPFWNRWMKRLPTIAKLANAREPTILKLWEGLGYYSRVRNLQKAARQIQEGHQGAFPTNPLDIKALIGVGRYTGGAISSIAFDLPEPILDGNVIRVLTRVFGIVGDPKSKVVNERLWDQAGELVVSTKTGVSASRADSMVFAGERSLLNQGMMELGATVCLPSNPDCGTCPLRRNCIARKEDRIEQLPESKKRPPPTLRTFITIVLHRDGEVFIRQRPKGSINAGFWEFPSLETGDRKTSVTAVCRKLFGTDAAAVQIDRFKHSITRYRYEQIVYLAEAPPGLDCGHGEWIAASLPRDKPFYSPQIRIFKKLAS